MNFAIARHEDCPDAGNHTKNRPAPWNGWALAKLTQTQCPTCGFWVIFTERNVKSCVLKMRVIDARPS